MEENMIVIPKRFVLILIDQKVLVRIGSMEFNL